MLALDALSRAVHAVVAQVQLPTTRTITMTARNDSPRSVIGRLLIIVTLLWGRAEIGSQLRNRGGRLRIDVTQSALRFKRLRGIEAG